MNSPGTAETTLRSERLVLRPWRDQDADRIVQIMADERMRRFLPLPHPYGPDTALDFIRNHARVGTATGLRPTWALAESDTSPVLGCVSMRLPDGPTSTTGEVGYWLDPAAWGRGYVTEAVRTVVADGFATGLRRAEILCAIGNVDSAGVALRAGFAFEGVQRRAIEAADGSCDAAVFSRVDTDDGSPTAPAWPDPGTLTDGVLAMRLLAPGDEAVLLEEWNNAESRRWSLFDTELTRPQATAQCLRAGLDRLTGAQLKLVLCDAATGDAAGTLLLRRFGPPGVVGIGYGVVPRFRGRGLTTRALRLVTRWGFDSDAAVHRFELGCKVDNVASATVAERAGFRAEGTARGRLRNPDGGISDETRFGLTRADV